METATHSFRLRPRRAWATWMMLPFGAALILLPILYGVRGNARVIDILAGCGVFVGAGMYLASPTWRSRVVVDGRGLEVQGPRKKVFQLAWNDVREVLIDEEEQAALVRGPRGTPSFLLPSPAHPAPYLVSGRAELYAQIARAVPADRVKAEKKF